MKTHGVMNRFIAFTALSMLIVPSVLADEKPVRIAHYAVTRLIKDRLGRDARVVFEKENDGFLSFSERKVTGDGYVRDGGRTKDFKYSVKVKPSSEEYRDVDVDFTNDRYRDNDRWNRTDWDREREWDRDRYDDRDTYVRFKSPYNSQRYREDEVNFRGEASKGKVRLRVYDWDGKTVLDRDLGVVRGEWWTTARFNRGMYKAIVELNGSRRDDTRQFTVRDWDEPRGYLRFDSIDRGGFSDTTIRLSGNSSADYVRIRIYDNRDKQVCDREVRVRNNRWSYDMRVDRPGSYRAKAENVRGRGDSEVRFNVSNGRDRDRDRDRDRNRDWERDWQR